MESVNSIDWCIDGNDFIGSFRNFGLYIKVGIINEEIEDRLDPKNLGFILTIYCLKEKKRIYCSFPTLEETLFFINHYVIISKDISEINNRYNSYCISEDVINNKGYSS